MPIEGFNFDEAMAAQNHDEAKVVESGLVKVRAFTKDGIAQVEALLKKIRADKEMYKDEVDELVNDPEYTKEVPGSYLIDPERKFETKKDLCEYFVPLFGSEFLEANRKNVGLWTWLALAYYKQFVKTVKGAVKLSANDCWVYRPMSNRFARRHFVAAPIYLYLDVPKMDEGIEGLVFSRPVTEFNKLLDYLTNVSDSIRTPSYLAVASGLYYDPNSAAKYKKGCLSLSTGGNVFQYTRVLQQLRETYDFSVAEDSSRVWKLLPSQFDYFKKSSVVTFDEEN